MWTLGLSTPRNGIAGAVARVLLVCAMCALCACAMLPQRTLHTLGGQSMGSTWSVQLRLHGQIDPQALQHGIQQQLDVVVAQMSTWEPDSDISRYNRAAAGHWQPLPEQMFEVLRYALALARDTGGRYDPTVGPLVDLWGFGAAGTAARVPAAGQIEAARARVGWQRISLDEAGRRALQPGGVQLDLSSIAPGFAVDQVARYLQEAGVQDFLIELGGELRVSGRRAAGAPWRVGVERPGREGELLLQLSLDELSMGASGSSRNFFERDGRRYSHHIDPTTGMPVAGEVAAAHVLHASCMQADALAMAVLVLGPQEGLAWAQARGLAALLVLHGSAPDELLTTSTTGFQALLQP